MNKEHIRRPANWLSVDWENAGWGDPAFEIADLPAHPSYLSVSTLERQWVIGRYAGLCGGPSLAERISVYYVLLLAWWAAWFARTRHAIAAGRLQPRLAQQPQPWLAQVSIRYEHYLHAAQAALDHRSWQQS